MTAYQVGDTVVLTDAIVTPDTAPDSPWASLKPGQVGVVTGIVNEDATLLWVEIDGLDPVSFYPPDEQILLHLVFAENTHAWPLNSDQVAKVQPDPAMADFEEEFK